MQRWACLVRCHEWLLTPEALKRYMVCCGTEHIGSIIELCVFFCLFQCNTITAVPLLWVCRRLWAAALSAVNSVEKITLMPHNHSYITHTLILCFDFTFSSLNSTQLCFQCSIVGKVRLRFAFISHRWQSNKVFCHVCGSFWFLIALHCISSDAFDRTFSISKFPTNDLHWQQIWVSIILIYNGTEDILWK